MSLDKTLFLRAIRKVSKSSKIFVATLLLTHTVKGKILVSTSRHRGFSLERGLDSERRIRHDDREWRMSASPVMIHGHLKSLRSRMVLMNVKPQS